MPIQIRLTVLGQAVGGGAPGGGCDVRITAPADTPLAEVLGALSGAVAPGAGTPGVIFCEDQRLDPRRALLGQPPLVDGAVLAFHRPVASSAPEPVGGRLLVVAGPDAGGVHLLRGGGAEVRVGRSADADVPLDDPDVSRHHCLLSLSADGSVTVTDLGSTNGTLLGGRPAAAGRAVPVPPGTVLRVGESALRVIPAAKAVPAKALPAEAVPAVAPPVAAETAAAHLPGASPRSAAPPGPAPAEPARRTSRGLASWARRLGGAAEVTHVGRLPLPGAAGAAPVAADPPADPRWPDPATLLLAALDGQDAAGRGPRPWERGVADPAAFGLRLGTVQRADGRLVPMAVSLPEVGSLGLAGPRHRLLGLARAALAQLAALHPPSALELVVLAPGRTEEWSWLCWLPHLRPHRGQDCALLTGFDQAQAAARVAELAERLRLGGREAAPERRTVVLVDADVRGGLGEQEWQALTELAGTGPAAGIHVLCLAETASATASSPLAQTLDGARRSSPAFAACGAAALLSGPVASAVRLTRPGGLQGQVATVDAVSAAWAERLARALAPLREESAALPEGAGPGAGLPESCRLLDVLDLPRVTPGALHERWAGHPGLPVTFGAGPGGPAGTDLAAVTGPLVITGPPRSGRTELLCSLAASLATAHGPRELSVLLVEGLGEGLRPCAELPHVAAHLGATDPVRMRAFAQAVRGELKRRAALLGEADFQAARQRAGGRVGGRVGGPGRQAGGPGMGRLAAPRPAGDDARRPGGEELPAVLAEGSGPLPWLVLLVDDFDALLAPALGAPGRQAAGSVVRALDAAVREGHRLGVRVITVGGQAPPAGIRIAMAGHPAGRAELRRGDGRGVPFQCARVTGRIPRTATLRPTATRLDWARAGDPPTRRPVRELGNGPTDVALLASAASRAAQSGRAAAASLV